MTDLVSVRGLTTEFHGESGPVRAVDNISFSIPRGGTVGLVGESGCGKSVTSLSIMGLVAAPGRIASGDVLFDGVNLAKVPEQEMRRFRGNRISMIFQEPMTSLNPVFTIGDQIAEVFRIHRGLDRDSSRKESIEMLRMVRIPSPETRIDDYPHQLSGGMRQRVMIAMALACRPELLIADEPTTALDVTIQAQILELMSALQRELGTSILLITHDLGVVAEVCRDVIVMYAGRIVEKAPVADIFSAPRHPYTKGLLNSIPRLGRKVRRLPVIEGSVPSPGDYPKGCRFQDRCPRVVDKCRDAEPLLESCGSGHEVACWRPEEN
jgi:oligopeptide/dipeptide ABC transporter ATP-binding protein